MKLYQVWVKGEPLVEDSNVYMSSYSSRQLAEKAIENYKATDQTDGEWYIEEEELDSRQIGKAERPPEVRAEVNTALFTYKPLTIEQKASQLAQECHAAGSAFFELLQKDGVHLCEDNHVEVLISVRPGMMGERT